MRGMDGRFRREKLDPQNDDSHREERGDKNAQLSGEFLLFWWLVGLGIAHKCASFGVVLLGLVGRVRVLLVNGGISFSGTGS